MGESELMDIKAFAAFAGWSYQKGRRVALKYGKGHFVVELLGRVYVSRSLFMQWIELLAKDQAMEINGI